ncbi:MAG: Maf family protein [Anaerostipes sp.]|nr:Maf family protein [Anaerostipes sp.]
MKKIILASGSPRRREIFSQVGLEFQVKPSKVEEIITKKKPEEVVMELSMEKARDIAQNEKNAIVVGADTIVSFQGNILGKPENEEEAAAMLSMLSGQTHQVYTGVTLVQQDKQESFFEKTDVTFYDLEPEEIKKYIDTKDCMDKAGAYGIQGCAAGFIQGICGDYYNVVGFPIAHFLQILKKFR